MMETTASVIVGIAGLAALAVAIWPRTAPTTGARAVLTALIGASVAVTLAAIAAPYIH
ncbi:hypothetical protein HUF15_00605 [Streptomyces samsunensis]|uniref:hypothetical protein n=1 Tax=Streptomyces malaysiensis TaxID=92644 RepID=UPI001582B99E|nr:hypothetical protein [Streptomyces samsunensis]NUH35281.1 hypothetical protein [Streptomyces samsunensis]